MLNVTTLAAAPMLRSRAVVKADDEDDTRIAVFCNATYMPDGNHTCIVEFPKRGDAVTVAEAANKGVMPGVYSAAVDGGDDEKKGKDEDSPKTGVIVAVVLCVAAAVAIGAGLVYYVRNKRRSSGDYEAHLNSGFENAEIRSVKG